jgi:hypothetical protein
MPHPLDGGRAVVRSGSPGDFLESGLDCQKVSRRVRPCEVVYVAMILGPSEVSRVGFRKTMN